MSTVLVVAKAPVPGLVKTRLTRSYTPVDAARLAAAALRDTLCAALAVPGARCAVALGGRLDDAVDAEALGEVLDRCEVFAQADGGLAERLVAAHRRAAELGAGPVLQIGMDTPQVGPDLLELGLAAARRSAALGPAEDGGWWALGVPDGAAPRLDCLLDVPMSTSTTGESTRRALADAGLDPRDLPSLRDVDRPDDVAAVAAACAPGSRFRRTVDALRPGAGRCA
ncbi:TIGR04282 family arsenosugar biosynthesis glycosyltransferase [Tsukamurella ocularis]|uniref:TIGR04282 family arsenosugar biosynthesis glycosyltransferase n=1 Tax=Tsukamurella ocularis TaxID=1970234 RepID=UPI0039EFE2B0